MAELRSKEVPLKAPDGTVIGTAIVFEDGSIQGRIKAGIPKAFVGRITGVSTGPFSIPTAQEISDDELLS